MFDVKELVTTGIESGKDPKKLLTMLAASVDDDCNKIETFEKLYKEIYKNHLCDKYCCIMVDKMFNNKEHGKKWTIDQTNDAARKAGVTFTGNEDDYTPYEFWCKMHSIYYDYSEVFEESGLPFDTTLIAKMADADLADIDAPKGKLVNYFFFVMKNK